LLSNPWSAHNFGRRSLYLKYPYCKNNEDAGLGIEDWGLNILSIANSVEHAIVPRTLHAIRIKENAGENNKNFQLGLLPKLPEGFRLGREI
jgi:hypothetical protein